MPDQRLLTHPALRRGLETNSGETVASGYPALDAYLAGGGWPRGRLTEIVAERAGCGELSLLMPALAALSREPRWLAWIAPPHLPYAPALAAWGVALERVLLVHARSGLDRLWAAEQALTSGTCSAVLAWPQQANFTQLRRLQLAADRGGACGFLFPTSRGEPSPASLRLTVARDNGGIQVRILKGGLQPGEHGVQVMDYAVAGGGSA